MNRAILTGSIIVGIAVMMSISMIAPAFAANPWKDLYSCEGSSIEGTYYYLTTYEPCTSEPVLQECITKRGTTGHLEFKDLNQYDGQYQDGEEQKRCHKTSFWT